VHRADVRYLLINAPLTDPTASYHSIPYLVGATSAAGFSTVRCLDANIDGLNWLAAPPPVADLLIEAEAARAELERKAQLTRAEQLRYRYALKAVGLKPTSVQRAIDSFKDPHRFYDYGQYRQATLVLKRWMDVLSIRGFSGQFDDFTLRINNVGNLSSLSDLTNQQFIDTITRPFGTYFDTRFREVLHEQEWNVVGLSANYTSQLPFAIKMARLIREALPNCVLLMGGTEISDDIKCLKNTSDIWRLFPECDGIVGGEGESALIAVLEAVADGRSLPSNQPGLLVRNHGHAASEIVVHYEKVTSLPSPRYDVWDLSQYWSPEPVLLYSPTRGCYWNKCTFCDYGLNTDLPTSPSRNRSVDSVIDELREISQVARTFYFSVDAIAPAYLRKLAQAIVAAGISIRWSAELRLEKTFLKEGMAHELREAGCVAVSFGYESGSQRILDLINKGVRLEQVPELVSELANVGIAAQMMGFVGFPSETLDEAKATFEFLTQHGEGWTLAGIGEFVLTPGAMVAKRPADFGIQKVAPFEGDDIIRSLRWVDADGRSHFDGSCYGPALQDHADSVVRFVDARPFVGGIDSAHSILYFAHFGPPLVPPDQRDAMAARPIVTTARYVTPLHHLESFMVQADVAARQRERRMRGQSTTASDMLAWLSEVPAGQPLNPSPATIELEIYPNGDFMQRSRELDDLERQASPAYHRLKELLLRESGVL